MTVLKLISFPSTNDGTFGALFYQDKNGFWLPFVCSLERKWLNNEKGKSCIPRNREYPCVRVLSPHFGDTFQVMGDHGRTEILFHKGNLDDDSHGCLILGEMFNQVWDRTWGGFSPGLLASGPGFAEFKERLGGEHEFKLVIQEAK